MDEGFPPDTISSDVHALCIDELAYDQVTTMSKFLALGMLADFVAAFTLEPARGLGRPDLGVLEPRPTRASLRLRTESFRWRAFEARWPRRRGESSPEAPSSAGNGGRQRKAGRVRGEFNVGCD